MRRTFVRTVPAEKAAQALRRFFRGVLLLAALVTLFLGQFSAIAVAAFGFCCLCLVLARSERLDRSPFSLLLFLNVSIYLALPMAFMAVLGDGYEFGLGLLDRPFASGEYAKSAPTAIAFLGLCVLAIHWGFVAGNRPRRARPERAVAAAGLLPMGLLCLAVIYLTVADTAQILSDMVSGEDKHEESLLVFILFDHAFLLLGPLVYFIRASLPARWPIASTKSQFAMMILALWAVTVINGSKGGILGIAILSFVIPLSYLRKRRAAVFLVPSRFVMVMFVPVSIAAFAYTLASRELRGAVGSKTALTVVSASVSSSSSGFAAETGKLISYRLGAVLDRYVLTFHNLWTLGFDAKYSRAFRGYLTKNFANLVLPGTPYPEAYSPSSNLFGKTLRRMPLSGEATRSGLLRSLNTQPYSMFGVAILLVGMAAPLFIFLGTFVLARWYSSTPSMPVKLTLLYGFQGFFHSYGLEVVLATTIHVLVSILIMKLIARGILAMKGTGQIRAPSTAPSYS